MSDCTLDVRRYFPIFNQPLPFFYDIYFTLHYKKDNKNKYIYNKIQNIPYSQQMWNLISSNRILDMRSKQQSHNRHLKALKNMRPTMSIKQPQRYSFLDYKAKAIQKVKQRNQQIEEHNSLLVKRMITMPSYVEAVGDVYFKNSLNAAVVRHRERSIDTQNQKIVRRLQTANSKYSQRVMSKSVKSYYKAKTNMASSKMDQFYDFESLGKKKSFDNLEQHFQSKSRSRPFSAKK